MKKVANLFGSIVLVTLILGFPRHCKADIGIPYKCEFTPITPFEKSGPVDLKLEFTPLLECDSLTFIVTTTDNLKYSGEKSWVLKLEKDETYSAIFHVDVPPNDTSMIQVEIRGFGIWCKAPAFFVTTGDLAKHYRGNPEYELPFPDPERPRRQIGIQDEVRVRPEPDTTKAYIQDEDGNWIELVNPPHPPPPAPPREPMTLDSLHKLEQEPLVGMTGQRIKIGDQVWERKEGEYKFHLVEPVTDVFADIRKRQAERQKLADSVRYHITLDLRKQDDFTFVRRLVDSLIPMEREGFYHAIISKKIIGEIEHNGIRCARYPNYPSETKAPIDTSPEKKSPQKLNSEPSGRSNNRLDVLFFEGFEEVWPGVWSVGDANSADGYDYWGDLYDWYVVSGWWSVL